MIGAGDRRGDDRDARLERQPAGAVVGRSERVGVLDARALREHDEQPALLEDQPRGLDRLRVGLTAAHGERAEPQEQPAERAPEQLRLGHVAHVAARCDPDEEGVEKALVVRRDYRRPLGRDVLGPGDANAKPESQ